MRKELEFVHRMIEEGRILKNTADIDDDLDNVLDQRDGAEFEDEWLRANSSIENLLALNKVSAEDSSAIEEIRERSYKKAYELSESPDFAAFVSDDFGLIAAAIVLDHNDPWLNAIWISYKTGSFPYGAIRPVPGRLRSLLSDNY